MCNKGGVYDRFARLYDVVFGAVLQPGRERAIRSILPKPGLRVLELGIGTGLTIGLYPRNWIVVGVDLSFPMLAEAKKKVAEQHLDKTITLLEANGERLPFNDESFDVVVAPYVMSVVPDPVGVGRELRRVCRPGGRIILLNHFLSQDSLGARLERWISPLTRRLGWRTDLSLPWLLKGAGLTLIHTAAVNMPPIWKLVTCVKE